MKIERLERVQHSDARELNALLKQLSDQIKAQNPKALEAALSNENTEVWVAREEEKIIGVGVVVLLVSILGVSAHIDEIVVDEKQRGKGIGTLVMKKLIARAKARGAMQAELTSRPSRVAANALYKKLGFEQRETNVYRIKL